MCEYRTDLSVEPKHKPSQRVSSRFKVHRQTMDRLTSIWKDRHSGIGIGYTARVEYIIRTSKLAAQIYAPLGTTMSLGDYVRVCRTFIEVFKWAEDENKGSLGTHSDTEEGESVAKDRMEYIMTARRILKVSHLY